MSSQLVSAALAGGLLAGSFLGSRGFAAIATRADFSLQRSQGLSKMLSMALLVVSYTVPFAVVHTASLSTLVPSPVAVSLDVALVVVLAVAAVQLLGLGFRPLAAYYETPPVPEQYSRRRRRAIVVLLLPVALAVELAQAGVLPSGSLYWLPLLFVGVVYGGYRLLTFPVVNVVGVYGDRRPSSAERTRLEEAAARLDADLPPTIRIDPVDRGLPGVYATGREALQSLRISEDFLEDATDTDLRVALGQELERNRRGFYRYWIATTGGLPATIVVFVYALVASLVPFEPATVFTLGLVYLGYALLLCLFFFTWKARQATYRADQIIAETLGDDAVRETYGRLGDRLSHAPGEQQSLLDHRLRYVDPTPGDRIRALAGGRSGALGESDAQTPWAALIGALMLVTALAHLVVFRPPSVSTRQALAIVPVLSVLAVALLLDSRSLRQQSDWPDHRLAYVAGSVVPIVSPLVGGWYLLRRQTIAREAVAETAPGSDTPPA